MAAIAAATSFEREPLSRAYQRAARPVAAVIAAGLALGLLVGGIGGRLAMRALFLTSPSALRGMISDDGFPIGRFDLMATLNLLVAGTLIGVIGAFVYIAVRPFLLGPPWLRYAGCGIAAGLVVGSMLVVPDGRDFTHLSPRWFAIALFVGIPAVFGLFAGPTVERAIHPDGWFQSTSSRWALAPLAVLLFPPLLVLVGVPVAAIIATRHLVDRSPRASSLLRSPAVLWTVRAVWVAIGLLGGAALLTDIRTLL